MATKIVNGLLIVLGCFLLFLVIVIILCVIIDVLKYKDLQRRLKEDREGKQGRWLDG